MEISRSFVFQTDSEVVNLEYQKQSNYLIEYEERTSSDSMICAIYFSSNEIYFPNTKEIFERDIVKKNKFEWYKCRLKEARKHIFIRDIKKQWYLEGINSELNSVSKLEEFLKKETQGFSVVTIGSSAGGYAAVLFGGKLSAKKIFSFNGQFMLNDLLHSSTEEVNPTIFRNKNNSNINKYFSLKDFIGGRSKIFYFLSKKSVWDFSQYLHIKEHSIITLFFTTSHHGIPFLKIALPDVINTSESNLISFSKRSNNPVLFALKFSGLYRTAVFLFKNIFNKIFK